MEMQEIVEKPQPESQSSWGNTHMGPKATAHRESILGQTDTCLGRNHGA